MSYPKDQTPKIGIVSNSINVFSEEGKQAAETQMKALLEGLKKEHLVSEDSFFLSQAGIRSR